MLLGKVWKSLKKRRRLLTVCQGSAVIDHVLIKDLMKAVTSYKYPFSTYTSSCLDFFFLKLYNQKLKPKGPKGTIGAGQDLTGWNLN